MFIEIPQHVMIVECRITMENQELCMIGDHILRGFITEWLYMDEKGGTQLFINHISHHELFIASWP